MRLILGIYAAVLAGLAGLAALGAVLFLNATGPDTPAEAATDDHAYNFVAWEIEHFPRKWIYKLHNLFDGGGSADSDEAAVQRYFELTREISTLQQEDPVPQRLTAAHKERDELEAEVEDILEGRMTSVLEDEGLALEPPLFSDLGLVFPPVDFELDSPPRVLAISPRDRIALDREFALDPGLTREQYIAIEDEAESENGEEAGVAALVVGTSGVSTYPSVLSAGDDYEGMIDTAFHEWLHQYLVFFPLGRSYFEGGDVRTLNESVASLGGRELAKAYFERHGGLAEPAPQPAQPAPTPAFDFTEEMRALRREVEALLAEGKIIDAEELMEQRRQVFQEHSYRLRKINQAYFAFNGFYAFSPGSTDPIGPQLQTLFEESGSPGGFLRAVRGVTSRAELDQAVAAAGGG